MKELQKFPDFASICLSDKASIYKITSQFEGFSDFNFINLYSWNIDGSMQACTLHGNLVIKFRDYITGECFLSFIGGQRVVATAQELLTYAVEHDLEPELRLIPEFVAREVAESNSLKVAGDLNSRDYVISLEQIAALPGKAHKHTKRLVKKFQQTHGARSKFVKLNLQSYKTKQEILRVFAMREERKPQNNEQQEFRALTKLLYDALPDPSVRGFGIRVDDQLRAFIIIENDELLGVTGHFWKADTGFVGIYHYLIFTLAQKLVNKGVSTMNIEQDLGIPGLRQAKEYLRPVAYLYKYRITPITYLQNGTAGITDNFAESASLSSATNG